MLVYVAHGKFEDPIVNVDCYVVRSGMTYAEMLALVGLKPLADGIRDKSTGEVIKRGLKTPMAEGSMIYTNELID